MAKAPVAKKRVRRSVVIDIHTHVSVPRAEELMRDLDGEVFGEDSAGRAANPLHRRVERSAKLKPRLNDMDKAGADIHVVSSNTQPSFYAAKAGIALKIARAANEGIAEYVGATPDRFVGLGMVPLQNPKSAVKELDYAITKLGLRGVNILSNIQGRDLGEEKFWPFWQRAEQLGAAVLIHPLGFTHPQRMKKFFLANTVGQPLEETLAMLSLIYEGVMERLPKLKVVMAHGGGYLPFYSGRSDSTYHLRPDMRGGAKRLPSDYIRRFHLDCCVFDRGMIEYLVSRVGAGQVLLGSDYPYRDWDALGMIRGSRKLSAAAKERILWRNAARLLNIRV